MSLVKVARFIPNIQTTGLLICDVQERFRPLIHNLPAVIHTAELLNQAANLLEIPTLISEQNPKALGSTVPEISLFPNTLVYPKTKFSMIIDGNPSVSSFLTTRDQFIICGIETHVCVMQTALDLLKEGMQVFIASDAVSSQRPYDRTVAMDLLRDAGATISTTESLLFLMLKDATHPNFKAISSLIKAHNALNVPTF